MKLKINLLGQEVKLLKIELVCYDESNMYTESNLLELTFDNSKMAIYYHKRFGYSIDILRTDEELIDYWYHAYPTEYRAKIRVEKQEIQLSELENIESFIEVIEKTIRNTININSVVSNVNDIISKCVLFNNITKKFLIFPINVGSVVIEPLPDDYKIGIRCPLEILQLIKVDETKIKKLLIKKDGLGMNTKEFCTMELVKD